MHRLSARTSIKIPIDVEDGVNELLDRFPLTPRHRLLIVLLRVGIDKVKTTPRLLREFALPPSKPEPEDTEEEEET